MQISTYAPYAKERFETAHQRSILHLERIVRNPDVIQTGSGLSVPGSRLVFTIESMAWSLIGLELLEMDPEEDSVEPQRSVLPRSFGSC